MRAAALATFFGLLVAVGVSAETVGDGLTGSELLQQLRSDYYPVTSLSYRTARHVMFSDLDNQDGFVRLVYTGKAFRTSDIPNANKVNTEHTWPQSKFKNASGKGGMKTDLHHLYPTYNRVNGERGHKPFAEISDSSTQKWWVSAEAEHGVPAADIEDYSESTSDLFEPREDHKGNVARALAYFYTVYGSQNIQSGWFLNRIETLSQWHKDDPADAREIARSAGIAEVQGTENPFVVDATAFDRVFLSGETLLP